MAKIVFFGTPEYVIPIVQSIKQAGHQIVAVFTQPPKPVGRQRVSTASAVGEWAAENGILVFSPETLNKEITEVLEKLAPDVIVLAAYAKLIPSEVLKIPRIGALNIHPSLLPKYRGPSPVQAAIAVGDKQTGATIIQMDELADHGPIISQFSEEIKDDDTTGRLRQRLFKMAGEVLATILPAYLEGRIELREQDHSKATFTTLIKKEHGFIPPQYLEAALAGRSRGDRWLIPFVKNLTLHSSPITTHNFIRALDPWPGAWTQVKFKIQSASRRTKIKRLKILKAHLEKSPITDLPAGALTKAGHRPPVTKLVLDQVQLEGKNPVTWRQFKEGYPDADLS